jgi:hypothetical protein
MTTARRAHSATLLPDGKVLIAGGFTDGYTSLSSAEVYDPSTGAFTLVGNMTSARAWHSASLLSSGQVLIAGGFGGLVSAELYDPSIRTFTATADMTTGRWQHRAILLASGKVLIVPASDGADYDRAELYDPNSGMFRPTGWVSRTFGGSVAHTANLLPSGTVLVTLAPSECDDTEADAQLYDPATETFTATGPMITRRCFQGGTSLSDGSVLISGNWTCRDPAAAEVYSPASGDFAPTGGIVVNRAYHTATLLKDGRVLIAGGIESTSQSCGNGTAAAELYTPGSTVPPPVLLSVSDAGQDAILHASTHRLVSPSTPALAGETLEIYLTGLIDGSVIPPQVAIGGRMAEVLFFGKAPGYDVLNQINVRVPSGATPGSAVPLRLNYLNRPSNEVTLAIQ